MNEDDEFLINTIKWIFLGVTPSGYFVYEDDGRKYLYIPADKKNKIIRIKQED